MNELYKCKLCGAILYNTNKCFDCEIELKDKDLIVLTEYEKNKYIRNIRINYEN
jgi:hypothetical protein